MKNSINARKLDYIITAAIDNKLVITRNNTERTLDVIKVERKEDKGLQYYGIKFDDKGSDLLDIIDFIGSDIVSGLLETVVNTKLNVFCEQAIEKVSYETKKVTEDDKVTETTTNKEFTIAEFNDELTRIITQWSAREISQKSLMSEMSDLGKELQHPNTTAERKTWIVTVRLGELAVAIATQGK